MWLDFGETRYFCEKLVSKPKHKKNLHGQRHDTEYFLLDFDLAVTKFLHNFGERFRWRPEITIHRYDGPYVGMHDRAKAEV
jgi:hypothetical protein